MPSARLWVLVEHLHRQHADEGLHRPNREVDLAGDDQRGHAERGDGRHRDLAEQHADVALSQEHR